MIGNFIVSLLVYGFMMYFMTKSLLRYDNELEIGETSISIWKNKLLMYPLLVFAFFYAVRWNVGSDCNSYIYGFYECFGEVDENTEIGFLYLERVFYSLHLNHYFFVFTISFFLFGAIIYVFKNKPFVLVFFPLALFLTQDYWQWANLTRQTIACAFLLVSIVFMDKKRYWISALLIFIAMYFHKSVYAMYFVLPLLWLTRGKILNQWIQLGIFFTCFALQSTGVEGWLSDLLLKVGADAGYAENRMAILQSEMDINFGLRSYMTLGFLSIVIWKSKKLTEYFDSRLFNYIYNMFFVGACILMLFYANQGVKRAAIYFTYFVPFVASAFIYYCYQIKKEQNIWIEPFKFFVLFTVVGLIWLFISALPLPETGETVLYKFCFGRSLPTL